MKFFIYLVSVLALAATNPAFAEKVSKTEKKAFPARKKPFDAGDKSNNFYYNRTNIILDRKSVPQNPGEPPLIFDVEVRDGMSLYNQNGWFDMSSYTDKTGLMLIFGELTTQPIVPSTQYSPIDILCLDKEGKIIQIAPNIMLSELETNLDPPAPILAYLIIKGGASAELSINVGDEVQYSIFKKPPLVLNAPRPVIKEIHDAPSKTTNVPIDELEPVHEPKKLETKEPPKEPVITNIIQKKPDELEKRYK